MIQVNLVPNLVLGLSTNSETLSLTEILAVTHYFGVVGVVGSNPAAPISDDSTSVVKGTRKGPFLLVVWLWFASLY